MPKQERLQRIPDFQKVTEIGNRTTVGFFEADMLARYEVVSFATDAVTQEYGATLNNFNLNWTYNRTQNPISQTIDGGVGLVTPVSLRTKAVAGAGLTDITTYTISVVSDDGVNPIANATIPFGWKRYWGPSHVVLDGSSTGADVRAALSGAEFSTAQSFVTFTNATERVNKTAHGLLDGTRILFGNYGGALPTGLVPGISYYVVNKTDNNFQVSLAAGGAVVPFSTDGTGNSYYYTANSRVTSKQMNAGAGTPPNFLYICYLKSWGAPVTVTLNGFAFTDCTLYTITAFANASGGTADYYLLKTNNSYGGGIQTLAITS